MERLRGGFLRGFWAFVWCVGHLYVGLCLCGYACCGGGGECYTRTC